MHTDKKTPNNSYLDSLDYTYGLHMKAECDFIRKQSRRTVKKSQHIHFGTFLSVWHVTKLLADVFFIKKINKCSEKLGAYYYGNKIKLKPPQCLVVLKKNQAINNFPYQV